VTHGQRIGRQRSGWSAEGLDRYNEIADFVKADRMVGGGELCCRELYKVYHERRSRESKASSNNKLAVQPNLHTKPVPYDDLDSSDIMFDFSSGAEY
jgi:hypothetical protein